MPITAVMLVALTTVNDAALFPPKLTDVAPVKFVPVMVMVDPANTGPAGVNEVMVGTAVSVVMLLPDNLRTYFSYCSGYAIKGLLGSLDTTNPYGFSTYPYEPGEVVNPSSEDEFEVADVSGV